MGDGLDLLILLHNASVRCDVLWRVREGHRTVDRTAAHEECFTKPKTVAAGGGNSRACDTVAWLGEQLPAVRWAINARGYFLR